MDFMFQFLPLWITFALVYGDFKNKDVDFCINSCTNCGGTPSFYDGHCECYVDNNSQEEIECVNRIKWEIEWRDSNSINPLSFKRKARCGDCYKMEENNMDNIVEYFKNNGPHRSRLLLQSKPCDNNDEDINQILTSNYYKPNDNLYESSKFEVIRPTVNERENCRENIVDDEKEIVVGVVKNHYHDSDYEMPKFSTGSPSLSSSSCGCYSEPTNPRKLCRYRKKPLPQIPKPSSLLHRNYYPDLVQPVHHSSLINNQQYLNPLMRYHELKKNQVSESIRQRPIYQPAYNPYQRQLYQPNYGINSWYSSSSTNIPVFSSPVDMQSQLVSFLLKERQRLEYLNQQLRQYYPQMNSHSNDDVIVGAANPNLIEEKKPNKLKKISTVQNITETTDDGQVITATKVTEETESDESETTSNVMRKRSNRKH